MTVEEVQAMAERLKEQISDRGRDESTVFILDGHTIQGGRCLDCKGECPAIRDLQNRPAPEVLRPKVRGNGRGA